MPRSAKPDTMAVVAPDPRVFPHLAAGRMMAANGVDPLDADRKILEIVQKSLPRTFKECGSKVGLFFNCLALFDPDSGGTDWPYMLGEEREIFHAAIDHLNRALYLLGPTGGISSETRNDLAEIFSRENTHLKSPWGDPAPLSRVTQTLQSALLGVDPFGPAKQASPLRQKHKLPRHPEDNPRRRQSGGAVRLAMVDNAVRWWWSEHSTPTVPGPDDHPTPWRIGFRGLSTRSTPFGGFVSDLAQSTIGGDVNNALRVYRAWLDELGYYEKN